MKDRSSIHARWNDVIGCTAPNKPTRKPAREWPKKLLARFPKGRLEIFFDAGMQMGLPAIASTVATELTSGYRFGALATMSSAILTVLKNFGKWESRTFAGCQWACLTSARHAKQRIKNYSLSRSFRRFRQLIANANCGAAVCWWPRTISCAILILCAASSFARIGETEAQIEKRYGKYIPPRTLGAVPMKMHRVAGMLIGVAFIDGRSECEFFQKQDHSEFTDHEIQLLLEANGEGKKWQEVSNPSAGYKTWKSEDARIATYSQFAGPPSLMIVSALYQKVSADRQHKEESEKLKNF